MQARTLPVTHDLVGGLIQTLSRYGVLKQALR
jgi:hypothetical protein